MSMNDCKRVNGKRVETHRNNQGTSRNEQKRLVNKQKWVEKAHKRLRNQNKLQLIRNKLMSEKEQIEKQQIVLNQLAKGIPPDKVFKLVLRLSKAIAEIP